MKTILGMTVAALSAVTLIAGCSSMTTTDTATSTTGSTSSTEITGDITVFAAASLKSTFTGLGDQFQKDNAGTKVTFSFAGSSDLVTQLTQGAPADVFASAVPFPESSGSVNTYPIALLKSSKNTAAAQKSSIWSPDPKARML